MFFDYLWIPGVTNENWLPCFLGAPLDSSLDHVSTSIYARWDDC